MTDSLAIDFADREDVRAKLPAARRILVEKERTLSEAQEDWQGWQEYVKMLERRIGVSETPVAQVRAADGPPAESPSADPPASVDRQTKSPAQTMDLASAVVNRRNRPIKSQEVAETLRREGHDLPNLVVSNALFYAAKRAKPARVKQAGRGYYAPLSYEPPSADFGDTAPSLVTDERELPSVLPYKTEWAGP